MDDTVVLRRSLIMVSALRPDDFRNAAASGADMVCADLEDGTNPRRRAEARAAVFGIFAGGRRPGLQERERQQNGGDGHRSASPLNRH